MKRRYLLVALAGFAVASPAAAQSGETTQTLQIFVEIFRVAATNAEGVLRDVALSMAISLAVIEIVVFALSDRETLLFRQLATRLAVIAFFIAAVASVSDPLSPRRILSGAEEIATAITGVDGLNPSVLVDQGIFFFGKMLRELFDLGILLPSLSTPTDILTHLFAAFGTLLAYLVIALQVTLTLVQGTFLLTLSPLFLAFGTSRWTIGATEAYVNQLVSWCVKLILLSIVLSIGDQIAQINHALLDVADNLDLFGRLAIDVQILVLAAAFAVSAALAPGMVAGKLGVHFNLTQLLGTGK